MANPDDPTDLHEISPIDLTEIVTNAGRDDFDVHLKVTREMGQTAADVTKEVERLRSAVPARHQTARHAITAGAVVGGLWVMIQHPAIAWPVAFIVAVLGGAAIAEQITKVLKGDKG